MTLFKKLSQIISSGVLAIAILLMTASPVAAQTLEWSGVCVGGTEGDVATVQGLECLIANVFTIVITLIGMGGFAMMIVASFRYLVSGGDTKGTKMAKDTFTFAVVGIVVALSSFIALNLIADFTGVSTLTQFKIPTSSSTP